MPAPLLTLRRRRRPSFRPRLEPLESRDLLSGAGVMPVPETEPNDTLAQAQPLGPLDNLTATPIVGVIGNSPAGAADVDWYQFTVTAATHVTLSAASDSANLNPVLSLYDTDPGNTFDPDTVTGHRLMVQVVGTGGSAVLQRDLAAGTYDVAVSGAGNLYFSPLLANSGFLGQTGGYLLQASGTTLTSPPTLLASDLDNVPQTPAQDGSGILLPTFTSSPLVLHFDTSTPLDPDSDIHLFDSNFNDLFFRANISTSASELQLSPCQALAPGEYSVVVNDPTGSFQLFAAAFQVSAVEGNTDGNAPNTIAEARNLGDVSDGSLVQVQGTVGADPAYNNPTLDPFDPALAPMFNPGNDVTIYHFSVTGTGTYALAAEVDAGRIGSALDPSMTLFRVDAGGTPVVIAGNNNTLNTTPGDPTQPGGNPTLPLLTDSALFASLTAGDYYIAVSSRFNYADPVIGRPLGQAGVFDPTVPNSGSDGGSIGNYVLSLRVAAADRAPQVVATTINSTPLGGTVAGYPTDLDITFSGPVNLQELGFQAFAQNNPADQGPDHQNPVFITDQNGDVFVPRLVSYDSTTFQAHFVMFDRLPDGPYVLHISGPAGLTDFSGTPVAGNTPAGDYEIGFQVASAPAVVLPVPTQPGNDTPATSQDLGPIFGREFENQFTVRRDFTASGANPTDSADYYTFQVLQSGFYSFFRTNVHGAVGSPDLVDAGGNTLVPGFGGMLHVHLDPGTYHLRIGGWNPDTAGTTTYTLVFSTGEASENPTPLTVGAPGAVRLQLVGYNQPSPPGRSQPSSPSPGQPSGPTAGQPPSQSPGQSPGQSTVLSLPPAPGPNPTMEFKVTPTPGTTTGGTAPGFSGLNNLLPSLATALAGGTVGGLVGPGTAADGDFQVLRLNVTIPGIVSLDGVPIRIIRWDDLGGGDDVTDTIFTRFGDALESFFFLFLRADGTSSNTGNVSEDTDEPDPFLVPETATEDGALSPSPDAVADSVWTDGTDFAGAASLLAAGDA